MTIPEAASLVVEAAVLAQEGETYVLDMGQPVAIIDLVRRYLALTGKSNRIIFTGLRTGEKLNEQLIDYEREDASSTSHPRISRINRRPLDDPSFLPAVCELCECAASVQPARLLELLWELANPAVVPAARELGLLELVS